MSLFEELGGAPAIEAALDRFYAKVMADPKVSVFFREEALPGLKRKQHAFLTMAFGGPNEYQGRDLRTAHAGPRVHGLDEGVFETYMRHFRSTLEELGVDEDRIGAVMGIAYTGKADVLGQEAG